MRGQKKRDLLSTYYGMCQVLGWACHMYYTSHLVLIGPCEVVPRVFPFYRRVTEAQISCSKSHS